MDRRTIPPPPTPTPQQERYTRQVIRSQALGHACRLLAGHGHPLPIGACPKLADTAIDMAAVFEQWIATGER